MVYKVLEPITTGLQLHFLASINVNNDVMFRANFLILLLLILSFSVHAEEIPDNVPDEKFSTWLWNYLTVGASVTGGFGGRSVTIDVTRQGTNDQGKILENRDNEFL